MNELKVDTVSLRLWLRLLACTRLIENEIRGKLRENYEITLPRFDVMAQLYRYPEGLRMGEISQLLMVTGGNITGIIEQLVQEGLVLREPDPNDRRAYTARLSETGKSSFEAMALEHRAWVSELMTGLEAAEQEDLFRLLNKLRQHLEKQDS